MERKRSFRPRYESGSLMPTADMYMCPSGKRLGGNSVNPGEKSLNCLAFIVWSSLFLVSVLNFLVSTHVGFK